MAARMKGTQPPCVVRSVIPSVRHLSLPNIATAYDPFFDRSGLRVIDIGRQGRESTSVFSTLCT